MNRILLKSILIVGLLAGVTSFAQAQKFGDNLGNHIATKDLQMAGKNIFNAEGIAIGTTALTNGSVALQIGTANKAILVSAVAANADIQAPLNGMIVYNNTDNKFYLYQNSAWVTFAIALRASTDGIESVSNANGYTLTQVGQETVLKLAPADATNPGVVTAIDQTFGGNKTFNGNLTVATGATLNVADGASTLGGTLTVAGNLTAGTATAPATSTFNGTMQVAGSTILAGSVNDGNGPVSAVKITNTVDAVAADEQNYLVVDQDGNVKIGSFNGKSLAKYLVAVPAGSSANFDAEGNSGIEIVLNINDVKLNDAIVVNFAAVDRAKFAGLSILSAVATADGQVTVNIADFRNPAAPGYAAPAIDVARLIVTKYNAINLTTIPN